MSLKYEFFSPSPSLLTKMTCLSPGLSLSTNEGGASSLVDRLGQEGIVGKDFDVFPLFLLV